MLFQFISKFLNKNKNELSTVLSKQHGQGLRANNSYREFYKNYIEKFDEETIQANTSYSSFTLAVITDTHAKDAISTSFYGLNGLTHVQELNLFDKNFKIDMKAHLGDAIDGSDNAENSKTLLRLIVRSLNNSKLPFALVKGNHDDNDKFDEHTLTKRPSFGEDTYRHIVNPVLYYQPQIKYISEKTGMFYFDKGNVRTIFINTSDVPYKLTSRGVKKYDVKKVHVILEEQFKEIIEVLQESSNKTIAIFGHAPLLDSKGESGLSYNGRTLHELFVAFNQKLKGEVHNDLAGDFEIDASFDFSEVKNAKIISYICGHKHVERNYKFDDINYVLLNCSALMGKNHGLTTAYNKKWDRKLNTPSEFAGYIVDINPRMRTLSVLGYGAATRIKQFEF